MFRSLKEQIERTQGQPSGLMSRFIQYAGVLVLSVVVFGLLFLGVTALE